jgi:rhodanese-related sulfurtransferase
MLFLLSLIACSSGEPAAPAAAPVSAPVGSARDIDTAALATALEAGVVLLDVRTVEEFAGGHITGALNVPVGDLSARMGELEGYRGQELAIICHSGGRSARAASQLSAAGFTVANVLGGMSTWQSQGRPVTQ